MIILFFTQAQTAIFELVDGSWVERPEALEDARSNAVVVTIPAEALSC